MSKRWPSLLCILEPVKSSFLAGVLLFNYNDTKGQLSHVESATAIYGQGIRLNSRTDRTLHERKGG